MLFARSSLGSWLALGLLCSSAAYAELNEEKVSAILEQAKALDKKAVQEVPEYTYYVGLGKYVVSEDPSINLSLSKDGKKIVTPDLSKDLKQAKNILRLMDIASTDLITCDGKISEIIYGLNRSAKKAPANSFSGGNYGPGDQGIDLGAPYVGQVKNNYIFARDLGTLNYASEAASDALSNFYGVISEIYDGTEIPKFNLTIGICQEAINQYPLGNHRAYILETVKLDAVKGSMRLILHIDNPQEGPKTFDFSGESIGLNYFLRELRKDYEYAQKLDELIESTLAQVAAKEKEIDEELKKLAAGLQGSAPAMMVEDESEGGMMPTYYHVAWKKEEHAGPREKYLQYFDLFASYLGQREDQKRKYAAWADVTFAAGGAEVSHKVFELEQKRDAFYLWAAEGAFAKYCVTFDNGRLNSKLQDYMQKSYWANYPGGKIVLDFMDLKFSESAASATDTRIAP